MITHSYFWKAFQIDDSWMGEAYVYRVCTLIWVCNTVSCVSCRFNRRKDLSEAGE